MCVCVMCLVVHSVCGVQVWWQILHKVELAQITIRLRITIIHALLNLAQIDFLIFTVLRIFNKPF